ncbi:MAG TPA: GrpB family protein [Candidatus Tyrphobacter sp.]
MSTMGRNLIGGAESGYAEILPYDATWPERFESERTRIANALVGVARRIEHIGSTSVPDLAAKPIIDILVTVGAVEDEACYRRPLEEAGYLLRVRESGHRMFQTPERTVHVHAWEAGSEDERRHIEFRDRLRASAASREMYEAAKRELAVRYWGDFNEYADAKSSIIARILSDDTHDTRRAI